MFSYTAPKFTQWSDEYTAVKFLKVDGDANEDICEKYGVDSYPTFLLFKDGGVSKKFAGTKAADNIIVTLQEYKSAPASATSAPSASVSPASASAASASDSTEAKAPAASSTASSAGPIVNSLHSADEFRAFLKAKPSMVVDFYAAWCGPCKIIGPKFNALAPKYPTVCFAKVDADELEELCNEYNVANLPTFLTFRNGKVVKKVEGAAIDKIEAAIQDIVPAESTTTTNTTATTTTSAPASTSTSCTAAAASSASLPSVTSPESFKKQITASPHTIVVFESSHSAGRYVSTIPHFNLTIFCCFLCNSLFHFFSFRSPTLYHILIYLLSFHPALVFFSLFFFMSCLITLPPTSMCSRVVSRAQLDGMVAGTAVAVVSIDADKDQQLADDYGVKPTQCPVYKV